MKIPLTRPFFDEHEPAAAAEAVRSGWVTQGPRVAEFERVFAEYVGAEHAVAVSNCTVALHLSLMALGIGAGDEVIVPSMSYIASANSVIHAGATPVLVEIDPRTFNLDPRAVEAALTPRTKALMPVHQVGMPAELDAILAIAKRYDLRVVEDAACAVGSELLWNGTWERIGKPHGDLACFSFHPRKIITTGEGGMMTCRDAEIAARLRRLRQHGMSVSDRVRHEASNVVFEEHVEVGYNYRMTDIQAAVGLAQMGKLSGVIARRRELAARYSRAIAEIPAFEPPFEPPNVRSTFQSYMMGVKPTSRFSRNELMEQLLERGIATRRGVMTIHREAAYADRCAGVKLPVTEWASDQTLILPLYPQMTDEEQAYAIASLRELG